MKATTAEKATPKTTRKHAKAQCQRLLSSYPILSPKDPAAAITQATEVVDTLLRECQSDEHVTQVIDAFLTTALHCENVVAELVLYAGKTQRGDVAPPGCTECDLGEDRDTGEQRW